MRQPEMKKRIPLFLVSIIIWLPTACMTRSGQTRMEHASDLRPRLSPVPQKMNRAKLSLEEVATTSVERIEKIRFYTMATKWGKWTIPSCEDIKSNSYMASHVPNAWAYSSSQTIGVVAIYKMLKNVPFSANPIDDDAQKKQDDLPLPDLLWRNTNAYLGEEKTSETGAWAAKITGTKGIGVVYYNCGSSGF